MPLTPKNWNKFQHYKDRKPVWIKLHRDLLDDYAFSRLPFASQALAPRLWLLASEYEGGQITACFDEIAYRMRCSVEELHEALKPLIDAEFFECSGVLAERYQSSMPEKEEETQVKTEKEEDSAPSAASEPRQRRERRKPAMALSGDWRPNFKSVEKAKALGLTSAEIEREARKFINHALQNDRRCVRWDAAFDNWIEGTADRLGRSHKSQGPPGFKAMPNSPEFQAWRTHYRDKGQQMMVKELDKRVDEGRAFEFEQQWPPSAS